MTTSLDRSHTALDLHKVIGEHIVQTAALLRAWNNGGGKPPAAERLDLLQSLQRCESAARDLARLVTAGDREVLETQRLLIMERAARETAESHLRVALAKGRVLDSLLELKPLADALRAAGVPIDALIAASDQDAAEQGLAEDQPVPFLPTEAANRTLVAPQDDQARIEAMLASADYIVMVRRYDQPLGYGVHALWITEFGARKGAPSKGEKWAFRQQAVGLYGAKEADKIMPLIQRVGSKVQPEDYDMTHGQLREYIGAQVLPIQMGNQWAEGVDHVVERVQVWSVL